MPRDHARWTTLLFPTSLLLVFCSSSNGSDTGAGSSPPTIGAISTSGAGGHGGDGGEITLFASGSGSGGSTQPQKHVPVPAADAGIDAQPAPAVACGKDAYAAVCPLPPSYCANDEWLVFYQNPQCADGACQYEAWALPCDGYGEYCNEGGCVANVTL
jgi:hypothetical protein